MPDSWNQRQKVVDCSIWKQFVRRKNDVWHSRDLHLIISCCIWAFKAVIPHIVVTLCGSRFFCTWNHDTFDENVDDNTTVSDNYSGITLSPLKSKLCFQSTCHLTLCNLASKPTLLVVMLFLHWEQSLITMSNPAQQSLCVHSTYQKHSTLDMVDQYALLNLLMDRHMPRKFVSIFYNWLSKCTACERWGSFFIFLLYTDWCKVGRWTVFDLRGCSGF